VLSLHLFSTWLLSLIPGNLDNRERAIDPNYMRKGQKRQYRVRSFHPKIQDAARIKGGGGVEGKMAF
jgi:hypothetical protein